MREPVRLSQAKCLGKRTLSSRQFSMGQIFLAKMIPGLGHNTKIILAIGAINRPRLIRAQPGFRHLALPKSGWFRVGSDSMRLCLPESSSRLIIGSERRFRGVGRGRPDPPSAGAKPRCSSSKSRRWPSPRRLPRTIAPADSCRAPPDTETSRICVFAHRCRGCKVSRCQVARTPLNCEKICWNSSSACRYLPSATNP